MNPLEGVAAGLGVINVALGGRRSIWNYPFGIAMVSLYFFVFLGQKLYSDMLLQVFFLVVQLYGWWNWLRSKAEAGEVVVLVMDWAARARWLAGCAVATAVWGWLMHRYTDASYPWWDAAVAMMRVAAQILMSRRYLENWMLWIAVDLAPIPLYAVKDLRPTVALYVIFLALSIAGLVHWAAIRRRRAAA
jgi:nicotinamide mononucleotide transporter